jgi:outer membrane protein assembly factor BamD (BamD/ComL family)
VPPDIHQRALVRLGHVHCIHGERRMAVQLFERFQALYPSSPYRPLADCRSVRFRDAGK